MAQTTVELIIIDLDNECKAKGMFVNWDMYLAKEKEKIRMAFTDGHWNGQFKKLTSEEYYEKTYNK
jgi:hypothetical protein